jgi:hypothetical protein
MPIYVCEISGRGVLAFSAQSQGEAEAFAASTDLQSDLMVLETGGEAIWDGESDMSLREAFPEERDKWRSSRAKAILDGEVKQGEDWVTYLLPVTDPTDDA